MTLYLLKTSKTSLQRMIESIVAPHSDEILKTKDHKICYRMIYMYITLDKKFCFKV